MKRLVLTDNEKNELAKEYPFLLSNNFNHIDDVPSGWLNIVKEFLPKLKARLIEIDFLDKYKITQIKEKFGFIRWHDNTADDGVIKLVQELEQKSEKTCIICGEPAKYISLGWISPYCEDCKNHIQHKIDDKAFELINVK